MALAAPSEPWPLDKLQAASSTGRPLAVLVSTGAMNPMHAGHVQMLHQAAARLEAEGHAVIGAWASPSHDAYVQPKAQKLCTIGLTAPFRLALAAHATAADPLVAVGAWEAQQPGTWPDFPEVAENLMEAMMLALPDDVAVYYVCGTDLAAKCGLYRGMANGVGVVAVPRADSGQVPAERPEKRVFVAAPAAGALAGASSTKVRAAIRAARPSYM